MAPPGATLIRRLKGARRVVGRLLRERPDVINSHFALYAFPWLNLIKGTPLVVNFQGPWADEIAAESVSIKGRVRANLARRIERRVYLRADRVITLSKSFRDIAHQGYGVPMDRIDVIPGGVDLRPYQQAPGRKDARARLGWPGDRKILVSVRRLVHRMGLENLVDAIIEVKRAHPNVLLLIGGKGPISDELIARIERHDLQEHVRLLGFIHEEDLPAVYAAANLTIVPTVALEGFGLVTVESLASGTPVMGTSIGGTPEILGGLSRRLLFESPDPQDIACGIIDGLSQEFDLPGPVECRAYSEQYGWNRVAPRIKSVFEHAIKSSGPIVQTRIAP
jgi:glycogen synthase